MLSMWFKALVLIIAGLQFAASNFDDFVENEDLFNEDNIGTSKNMIPNITTGEIVNHTGLLHGSHEGGLWDRNADPTKEHGNMERLGREFVKKVMNAFERPDTQGLDTNATFFSGMMDKFKEYVHFIYPGTVWCGEGDQAGKSTDLGMFIEPDKCCRAHDKCHNYIEKNEKKYGLENTGMFTRSHCSCDRHFHQCLKDSKSAVGRQIGFTYFTVLGPQCFEEKEKIAGCNQTFMNRCIQYSFSVGKEKKYQWFDNPTF